MCILLYSYVKPCDKKRLEVMCGRTLKHTVDVRSHILLVAVQIMVVFCVYIMVYFADAWEFEAFIGSGESGICSCHWLWRIWNLQLSLALENLKFAAVIGSGEILSCLCPSVAVIHKIPSDLPVQPINIYSTPPLQDPPIQKVSLKVAAVYPSKMLVKAKQNTAQCKRLSHLLLLINWYWLSV
jgi:hypothetical protein